MCSLIYAESVYAKSVYAKRTSGSLATQEGHASIIEAALFGSRSMPSRYDGAKGLQT
jgi:hypothetical protein